MGNRWRERGADRSYTGTIKFGLKTNTGDIKGVPVAKEDATQGGASKGDATFLSREEEIVHLIPQFKGDVFQVDDFGDALGCGATLASLRRTCIGKFDIAEAVPFQKLLETNIRDFPSLVQPISKVL